ncbi:expression library immunization antigen 1 [Fusarium longipes]|uniref:Expression library immunization antigen 1 n=1 Tax=Fusarium longipes TaxID=694270 RepID=A0A395SS80_9HYPO|nr:expression library immunization antigen 1 [Fusarium longipes]
MIASKTLLGLATVQAVSAHFGLVFPTWRADTLSEENEDRYNQWTYPCAGVDYNKKNLTDWPLEGGSLTLDLHHEWSYIFVNLGLGENTTNFNISLTPEFLNATNSGTLFIEELALPSSVKVSDGDLASIQVVTVGDSGSALYNCADIRFKENAKGPSNKTGDVDYVKIKQQDGNGTEDSASNSTSGEEGGDNGNGAGIVGVNTMALTSVVGLAAAFAMGFSL